jgi:hypothetical protein
VITAVELMLLASAWVCVPPSSISSFVSARVNSPLVRILPSLISWVVSDRVLKRAPVGVAGVLLIAALVAVLARPWGSIVTALIGLMMSSAVSVRPKVKSSVAPSSLSRTNTPVRFFIPAIGAVAAAIALVSRVSSAASVSASVPQRSISTIELLWMPWGSRVLLELSYCTWSALIGSVAAAAAAKPVKVGTARIVQEIVMSCRSSLVSLKLLDMPSTRTATVSVFPVA